MKKLQSYEHSAVLPTRERPIRFNLTVSLLTYSVGVQGELDDTDDPILFNGIIRRKTKKGLWLKPLFYYLSKEDGSRQPLGDELSEEVFAAVLEAINPKKRRKKRG